MKILQKVRSNSGFTLAEMLITVGIIIILLAVAIPAVAQASLNFKMTELNSIARQVFVASQNNLTNLKTQGMLDVLIDPTASPVKYYGEEFSDATRDGVFQEDGNPNLKLILPVGSVDDFAYQNHYTILYNPVSATVLEVFYSESDFTGFDALTNLSGMDDTKVNARRDVRIGYYNGSDIAGSTLTKLEEPTITVTNDDRLTVNIESIDKGDTIGKDTRLVVTVTSMKDSDKMVSFYEDKDFDIPRDPGVADPDKRKNATLTLDSVFPSDTLKDGTTPIRFSTRVLGKLYSTVPIPADPDFPFSEQIKISAYLEPDPNSTGTLNALPAYSNEVETNGLYSSKKDDLVKVAYPRHLQNLDESRNPDARHKQTTNTGFLDKIPFKVEQTRLIGWYGENHGTEKISFDPINPLGLISSYDGKNYLIKDLWIEQDNEPTTLNTAKIAGLFGELKGKAGDTIKVENIRLVNPYLHANKFETVGTLIGNANYVDVQNSCVYILDTIINNPNTPNESAAKDRYKTIGNKVVGGMIGIASNVSIKDSYSGLAHVEGNGATPIVGGLIGQIPSTGGKVSVTNSYAVVDNLIAYNGTSSMFVANNASGDVNRLSAENSYAVGNIQGELDSTGKVTEKPTKSNGFFDVGTSKNSYAAVTYLDAKGEKLGLDNVFGFSANGNITSSYYLNPTGAKPNTGTDDKNGKMVSYNDLGDKNVLTGPAFDALAIAYSKPYKKELLELNPKEAYPFLGIKNSKGDLMPHYGSWPEKVDENPNLVYFEEYTDNSYGFYYYDDTDKLVTKSPLKGNTHTIKKAGYAMLTPLDQDITTMKINYEKNTGFVELANPFDPSIKVDIDGTDYDLRPFSILATTELLTQIKNGATPLYNSLAIQVVNDIDEELVNRNIHPSLGAAIAPKGLELGTKDNIYQVRTLEQLSNIDILAKPSEHYNFIQTHNIDSTGKVFSPKSFNDRTITNDLATPNTISSLKSPLFDVVTGDKSLIKGLRIVNSDIEIENNLIKNNPHTTTSPGYGIFGINITSGKVESCTVENSMIVSDVAQNVSSNVPGYLAGFVAYAGTNTASSVISDCDIISTTVEITDMGTAAGFVAENGGQIKNCQIYSSPAPGKYEDVMVKSKGSAFGFVASPKTSSTIEYSSVTGIVQGGQNAAGFGGDVGTSKITNSYANCNVKSPSYASGFVLDASNASVESCYAVYNVEGKDAYGFAQKVGAKVKNSFSIAIVKGSANSYGFAGSGKGTNCHYIGQNFTGFQSGTDTSYETMIDPSFANTLNSGTTSWTHDESEKTSYPYAKITQGKINPFPMIKGLPHYGDWLIIPETPAGLVYYETYEGLTKTTLVYDPVTGEQEFDDIDKTIPTTKTSPIYYIYGIDSSGLVTSNLRDNKNTISDAGYGILLPVGTHTQNVVIKYGDGGADTVQIDRSLSDPLDSGISVQTEGGSNHILKPIKRDKTMILGQTITQFDKHLSVPISITYGSVTKTYDMAPFSAQGVAPLDLNNLAERVHFGTDEDLSYIGPDGNEVIEKANAKVRTATQLNDIELYMGTDQSKQSPTRYFLQTHNVEMKDWTESNTAAITIMQSSIHNAVYDGGNNKIDNSKYGFASIIFANAIVRNLTMDNVRISKTAVTPGDQSNHGIFALMVGGTVDNCHVINSSIESTSPVVTGFIGQANKMFGNVTGTMVDKARITNCSVQNTSVKGLSASRPTSGFISLSSAYVDSCFVSNVAITGTNKGPVAGFIFDATSDSIIENSYTNGTITAVGDATAGWDRIDISAFTVKNDGIIKNSYSSMVLDGQSRASGNVYLSGFVGQNGYYGSGQNAISIIENCYSVSKATGGTGAFLYPFAASYKGISTNNYYLKTFDNNGIGIQPITVGVEKAYGDMTVTGMNFPATFWKQGTGGYPFPIITSIGSHTGPYPPS